MKLDKEFVIKNRFWVLLALTFPLSLAAILMMFTSVSGEIESKRKDLDGKHKKLVGSGKGELPNQLWIVEKANQASDISSKETEVWKKAFKEQGYLSTWASMMDQVDKKFNGFQFKDGQFAYEILVERDKDKKLASADDGKADNIYYGTIVALVDRNWIKVGQGKKEPETFRRTADVKITSTAAPDKKMDFSDLVFGDQVKITYEKSRYFNDRLTEDESSNFAKSYQTQLQDILNIVDPVWDTGKEVVGVVQFRGWPYHPSQLPPSTNKFFHYVPKWDPNTKEISEEAWVAQENLWIQKELYRMVRLANDYLSEFTGTGGKEKKEFTFYNPYWELRINWKGGKNPEYTLKNLLPRRQKVGMALLVKTKQGFPPEKVVIKAAEPLEPKGYPGHERKVEVVQDLEQVPDGIFEVQQVLTWETAAVKRIDQISIGNSSTDETSQGHRAFVQGLVAFPSKKEETKEAAPDPAANDPNKGFPLPGQGAKKLSPNGLVFERYSEVTRQARRLPVGIVLIVDQEHIDRVQTAFNNSKMRFWVNHVLLSRYPHSLRPTLIAQEEGGAGIPDPGFKVPRKGERGVFFPPPPGPGMGGQGMPPPVGAGGGDDQDTNVELVLYGTVTMYERNPPTKRRDALYGP